MSESYELTSELRKELEYLRRQNRLFRAILEKAPILISAMISPGNVLITSEQFSAGSGQRRRNTSIEMCLICFLKRLQSSSGTMILKPSKRKCPHHRRGSGLP